MENDIMGKKLYILKIGNIDIDYWNVVWCLNDVDGILIVKCKWLDECL